MDKTAIDFIVEKAEEFGLGARGLRTICESIFTDAMFELPSKSEDEKTTKLLVDRTYAQDKITKVAPSKLKAAS